MHVFHVLASSFSVFFFFRNIHRWTWADCARGAPNTPRSVPSNQHSHPLYGLLNPSVTRSPQVQWPGSYVHWGQPFPDSIKEAAELKDTKKQKWRGRIINYWHNGRNCVRVRPSTPGRSAGKKQKRRKTLFSDRNTGQTAGRVHKQEIEGTAEEWFAGVNFYCTWRRGPGAEAGKGDACSWWNKTIWWVLPWNIAGEIPWGTIYDAFKVTSRTRQPELGQSMANVQFNSSECQLPQKSDVLWVQTANTADNIYTTLSKALSNVPSRLGHKGHKQSQAEAGRVNTYLYFCEPPR